MLYNYRLYSKVYGNMVFKVLVQDYILDLNIIEEEFTDSNTAYIEYRLLSDEYRNCTNVTVNLIEPTYE